MRRYLQKSLPELAMLRNRLAMLLRRRGSKPSEAGLLAVGGTLYGTTSAGGANGKGGTVFSISPSGSESILHSFGQGTDGADPLAGLINVKGTLYGTTSSGGTSGDGTVFAITP